MLEILCNFICSQISFIQKIPHVFSWRAASQHRQVNSSSELCDPCFSLSLYLLYFLYVPGLSNKLENKVIGHDTLHKLLRKIIHSSFSSLPIYLLRFNDLSPRADFNVRKDLVNFEVFSSLENVSGWTVLRWCFRFGVFIVAVSSTPFSSFLLQSKHRAYFGSEKKLIYF